MEGKGREKPLRVLKACRNVAVEMHKTLKEQVVSMEIATL